MVPTKEGLAQPLYVGLYYCDAKEGTSILMLSQKQESIFVSTTDLLNILWNVFFNKAWNIVSVSAHCAGRALLKSSAHYDVTVRDYVLKQLKHMTLCFV